MIRLEDQVAIITGSGRGLGATYARLLSKRGARVVIHDVGVNRDGTGSDPNVAAEAAKKIQATGGIAVPSTIPLERRENCRSLIETTLKQFGRLNVLIHNTGWVAYQAVQELTPEFLRRAIDINLQAPTWLAQAAFPVMKSQTYGRIVLTISDRAMYKQYARSGLAAYAMGKMAQLGLMQVLAVEGRDHGIQVNAISPVAKTRMWNVQDEPADLRPDQVAPGVLFLTSPQCQESGYILRASNGQLTAGVGSNDQTWTTRWISPPWRALPQRMERTTGRTLLQTLHFEGWITLKLTASRPTRTSQFLLNRNVAAMR